MRRGSAIGLVVGLSALIALVSGASVASAQTFQMTSCAASELRAAITTANSNNQDDTIDLKAGCNYVATAVYPVQPDNGHSLTIVGHGATISGGGSFGIFYLTGRQPSNLTLQGVTLTDFVAATGDGAITVNGNSQGGTVKLLASTISYGQDCGGGIYSNSNGSSVTVSYSTISDTGLPNCPGSSSGIFVGQPNSTLLVNNSTITRNVANGGIESFYGSATIIASTISDNTGSGAGGIQSSGSGSLRIYSSTISGNTATGGAGGIGASVPTWITDSTITGNTGTSVGGILACCVTRFSNMATKVLWSTVADNTASISGRGGGDLATDLHNGGRISLKATIVASASSANGPDCAPNTGLYDFGYNLVDDASCPLDTSKHSLVNTPAGLDPNGLGNNGGPTQTIALQPSSPAVDYAPTSIGPPIQDQRLMPRPDAGESFTDIGAYELQNG